MKPFRLTLGAMAGWIAVIGFDLAVLVRAYQQGQASARIEPYVIGFGVILVLVNVTGWQAVQAVGRLRAVPPAERSSGSATPVTLLALYLLAMTLPILAILFFRPGPA